MKTVLLIGLGRFGRHAALKLNELGHQVMAIDKDEERVNDVMPYVTNAQIGDSTSEEFLESLGVRNFDVCIVTIGDNFQKFSRDCVSSKRFRCKNVSWQERPEISRLSFSLETEQIMSSIRKKKWQSGLPFVILLTIFLTMWPWETIMLFLRWKSRKAG